MIEYVSILLTDNRGAIAVGGEPIAFKLPKSARRLDQEYFRAILAEELIGKVVVVIGDNTWKELVGTKAAKVIRAANVPVLTSSATQLVDVYEDKVVCDWSDNECTLDQLSREVTKWALVNGTRKVVVLGGMSVYNSFSMSNTRVWHSVYGESIGDLSECKCVRNTRPIGDWRGVTQYSDSMYTLVKYEREV